MSLILHIETAIDVCSVAIANEGKLISLKESYEPRVHAAMTAVFVKEAIKEAGISIHDLEAIAVSKGPGSYTGLRIGVATAKGLCFSLDIPLIAVDTLKAMAVTYVMDNPINSIDNLLIPLIDARRMEVYGCVFNHQLNYLVETKAEVLTENSFMIHPIQPRIIFGDGAAKTASIFIDHLNVKIVTDFNHSARGLVPLALQSFNTNQFEDIAYFEPYYLKEFLDNKTKN